ncbi:hypothetical protein Taro_018853 [Colocasia esculenta]|uniref:CCHC-type domain-containing protein n=1 Tax=Colocasia esculenta TaxID=4460 RepID=A0A843USF9_COLES|nr:hypothetical protein [Colocasia esculenta]
MGQHSDIRAGNPTRRRGKTLCEAPHADHTVDVVLCASALKIWLPPSLPARAFGAMVVAAPSTSSSSSSQNADSEDNDADEVLYKLYKILKKKKNISRRIQRKEKKEKEPVCYECRKPGHLRPDCPRLKKTSQTEKPKKQHKKFKRRGMAAAWENDEVTSSESSSSDSEKEQWP